MFVIQVVHSIVMSQAEAKGLSATQYGFVIGSFTLGQVIVAPATGRLVPIMTTRISCIIGMLLMAISTIMFATLDRVSQGWTFFGLACMLRLAAAVGSSLMSTAAFTQLFLSYPRHLPSCVVSCKSSS
jgi:MFS family permease